jgi:hypothetical protein
LRRTVAPNFISDLLFLVIYRAPVHHKSPASNPPKLGRWRPSVRAAVSGASLVKQVQSDESHDCNEREKVSQNGP